MEVKLTFNHRLTLSVIGCVNNQRQGRARFKIDSTTITRNKKLCRRTQSKSRSKKQRRMQNLKSAKRANHMLRSTWLMANLQRNASLASKREQRERNNYQRRSTKNNSAHSNPRSMRLVSIEVAMLIDLKTYSTSHSRSKYSRLITNQMATTLSLR